MRDSFDGYSFMFGFLGGAWFVIMGNLIAGWFRENFTRRKR